METLRAERDELADRSQQIETRIREYLAQHGGKFP